VSEAGSAPDLDRLGALPEAEIVARFASAGRHIHDTGVAYRVYGETAERDWPAVSRPSP
jgi:uncharacterized circularly permuted ATP-grasp superfamily protein